MSLESILSHILDEARTQKEKIIQEATKESGRMIQETRKEAERLYQEILDTQKAIYEREGQKLIINSRLEGKKNLLSAKQELINAVFEKLRSNLNINTLKKQQVMQDKLLEVSEDIDFYLNKIRIDYEAEIAKILFD